ncbi:MAG: DUF3343 domain-containing protein [Anaerolineae bacterium]
MSQVIYGVVLFYTTAAALRGEKLAKEAGLKIKLIPVPRELSSNCGVALRFPWTERDQMAAALDQAGLEYAGIHPL